MFFNKGKITERKSRESRSFEFTDKACREYDASNDYEGATCSDKLCKNLRMYVSRQGNHTFFFQDMQASRTIGSVYMVTVKEAREIVNNIRENKEEFYKEVPTITIPLAAYIRKYGKYPHKPQGTDVIISDENLSLKQKIKDLQVEIDSLQKQVEDLQEKNISLSSRLSTIGKLANYDETDLEMDD